MDVTTETPAAVPVDSAPVELTLDQIVAEAVKGAEATGTDVVVDPDKAAEAATTAATETPPAEGEKPAESPADEETPADDVTAARVRKMLAKLEEKETALAAREAELGGGTLAELLKSPKAFLAKHGKSIDDVIDASLAEGKETPAATEDDNPRLTALEKRIEDADRKARQQATDAAIAERKSEIHREITASAKFPIINETKRQGLVTSFMVEYHSLHGKAISWDKAAELVEKDLGGIGIAAAKKLGWAAPAAKPAVAAAPADRPGTVSIGGSARDAAPVAGSEPEDPEKLLQFLVKQAGLG